MFPSSPFEIPVGSKFLCGDVMCDGLCLNSVDKFPNGTVSTNRSICYPTQLSVWCYNTGSKAAMIFISGFIFIIPYIFFILYYCNHKQQILKNFPFSRMYFLFSFPLITLFYLGATISQLICCFTFDVGSTLFYPLLCIYIIIILIKVFLRYPFSDSYKSPYLPTNFFIRPKVVTLEELQHDITKVRMAPPTFLVKGPNVKTYELEYLTWQEEGADVRLPSNVPIFAYFSIESYPASDVELEFTVNNRRGQTTYKIVANVDVECEPMILMNGNDKTFELLNRKYMRIVYLISLLFSFDFILDLVYWAHVEFVQIKCIKNASTKDELRAKYGEKDMNASANVQYDNELIHMSDADQIFSELNPNPTT